ncbi:MAG: type II toxin-antitoxin system VapC family toxin [Opitutaceae bacterium]
MSTGGWNFFSAFKRHQREGSLTTSRFQALARKVQRDEASGLVRWLPIGTELVASACQQMVALPPSVYLRAADALHLACAADAGLKEIYSHDRHLLAAAPHFKLKGIDVIKANA